MENPGDKNKIVADSYGTGAKNPRLRKGEYHAIGAACDESGKINTRPSVAVNVKTGYPDDDK